MVFGNFSIDLNELEIIQRKISKEVIETDRFNKKEKIGGVDVAYKKDYACACATVFKNKKFVEAKLHIERMRFPYIPGFLSFREGPVIIKAIEKLDEKPDITIFDGNGILHPRFCGIATHVGILLNIPTIGFAKKLLYGRLRAEPKKFGEYVPVIDREKVIGACLKNTEKSKPIFVSIGHRVSLKTAINIVLENSIFRVPEPVRKAHEIASGKIKKFSFRTSKFIDGLKEIN
ncbi:MAG: endonuclease V [Candidatus Parvarchaeota archaeon]|nr:endonuclease V [Candidatus Jingweiarchaeum tengchongense]MCW1298444.1 endonuclease V [Candidatus Jingweiarchaeum tengchongense]MCW1300536.1 endonuclease V [Candidatus Jingweiarchaeum tengchongense]MCW1304989.1 endonuclease V [Candidatus Jingweiarchaeum tengchongense]MCW1306009.1 endonuclease V [Candidatus Jingweiarchaeum tengchongense]